MNITRPFAAAAVAALAIAIAALSGCSVIDSIFEDGPPREPREQHYDEYTDAPRDGENAYIMPSFVPKDAVDIDVRALLSLEPGYLLRYTSPSGFKDAGCELIETAPEPAISSEWWPDSIDGPVAACSKKHVDRPVYVAAEGDTVYAWTADEPLDWQ